MKTSNSSYKSVCNHLEEAKIKEVVHQLGHPNLISLMSRGAQNGSRNIRIETLHWHNREARSEKMRPFPLA